SSAATSPPTTSRARWPRWRQGNRMTAVAERNEVAARFKPGDAVRVLAAAPLGHVRTPWYIRGHRGVVERICGAFPNPEELAYARTGEPRQPLYRVRFVQKDL